MLAALSPVLLVQLVAGAGRSVTLSLDGHGDGVHGRCAVACVVPGILLEAALCTTATERPRQQPLCLEHLPRNP